MARGRHRRSRQHTWRAFARRRRILVAGGVVAALVAGGTAAYAYWSASGAGAGTVQSTTAAPLTVTALAAPLADLYPGKTDDLGFRIANTNAYPVNLTKLTAITVTSSDQTNCAGATYITLPSAVTTGIAGGGYTLTTPINVPAGASAASGTLTGLITLSTSAPDACQGKTFTATMTFTGTQV